MQRREQASAHADRCAKSSEMFLNVCSSLYLKTEYIWQEKKNVVYTFDE